MKNIIVARKLPSGRLDCGVNTVIAYGKCRRICLGASTASRRPRPDPSRRWHEFRGAFVENGKSDAERVEGVFDTFIGEMFFLDEPVATRAVELLEAA